MATEKYNLIERTAKKIRIKIYDSVWIDEAEDVYMIKTKDVVETCIDDLLKELVDKKMIKWL